MIEANENNSMLKVFEGVECLKNLLLCHCFSPNFLAWIFPSRFYLAWIFPSRFHLALVLAEKLKPNVLQNLYFWIIEQNQWSGHCSWQTDYQKPWKNTFGI